MKNGLFQKGTTLHSVFTHPSVVHTTGVSVLTIAAITLIAVTLFSSTAEASFTCGTDTVQDADGNTYNTVQIGTQCWMASNLKVGTRVDGTTEMTDNATIEKYCYNDSDGNCDTYGGLYQWDEAMQYVTTEGAQGICPAGWHIPTDAEQHTLDDYFDTGTCDQNRWSWGCDPAGTALKSGGSSGFDAPLAGRRATNGSFSYLNTTIDLWSTTQYDSVEIWRRYLDNGHSTVLRNPESKLYGLSVRCLQDPDTTPPVRSNPSPSSNLPFGTTETTLSLDTDESATCKYSTTAGQDYSAMSNTFSTTGGTSHSTAVTGLTDDQSYTYYVRCEDGEGNANTDDYSISFSVHSGTPIGHWTFNGSDIDYGATNEVIDQGSGGNDGNFVNMDSSNATLGARGQALSFNGTDESVEIGNVGTGIKTISFRMRPDDITDRKILDLNGTAMIELNSSSEIVATNFPGTTTIYVDGTTGSSVTGDGKSGWFHVVITDTTGVNASNFTIGEAGDEYYDGKLDDVQLYTTILDSSAVSSLFGKGSMTIEKMGTTIIHSSAAE